VEIQSIQHQIQQKIADPFFKIKVDRHWGAENNDYRVKIREHLFNDEAAHFTKTNQFNLYNLQMLPQAEDGTFSISHCRGLGGYAFSTNTIGFDIEEFKRISPAIITRTCSEQERKLAPKIAFLWAAKEAAFKALASSVAEGNLVLTQIHCYNWVIVDNDNSLWSFEVHTDIQVSHSRNKGFVFLKDEYLFGLYWK